jgi:DNA-binding NtrC family response regulator
MADNPLPRILIVEDDATFRETVCDVLRDAGYRVRGARSLKKATKRLSRHEFDLVLTDVNIGDRTGFEVLQIATEKRPEAKIVLMSAQADQEIIQQALQAGAKRFLPKPFRVKELLTTLQEIFQEQQDAEDKLQS